MDQLFCMRVFTRVVEHGSFARAADDLAVSRPTVTIAVSRLEKRLGARLLHRTTRRLSLTDEGRAYYESCVRILDEIAEAEDAISSARGALRGRLRVSVPQAFAQMTFFPALQRFMARHPELAVDVVLTDRAVDLVEEGIDCAVRGVELPDDSLLVARKLARTHRITCASAAYLAAHGTPRSIADLQQHECVCFMSPSTARLADWQFADGGRRVAFTPRGRLVVTSLEAAVAAAQAGAGIAQAPDSLVFRAILAGELQPILLDHVTEAPALLLVYPRNRYLTAKVRAFGEFVAEIYPTEGWWPEIAERTDRRLARA